MNKIFIRYCVIAALIALVAGFVALRNGKPEDRTRVISRGEFVQQIAVSGTVVAASKVDLSFEQGGRIAQIGVRVGENVAAGSFIASQETTELHAQLEEMEAGIRVQRAKLDQLLAGSSPEDIRVAETAVANAEVELASALIAVQDARRNLADTLRDAYTKADDAVRGKTDQLFTNPRSDNPQLSVRDIVESKLKSHIEWLRLTLETSIFAPWTLTLSALSVESDLTQTADEAGKNLQAIREYLDEVSLAVNGLTVNSSLPQTTIDGWKSDIGTARTNVNTAIANITAAHTNLKTKEAASASEEGALKTAQDKLTLVKAPARVHDIALYETQIMQAEASAHKILVQISNKRLHAPFSGIITSLPFKVGATMAANQTVASLISAEALQIESYVPEIHAPFIKIGDEAVVTLDAYGSEVPFDAAVVSVDPAETVRDGVSTYKTVFQLRELDVRIKSGMTANVVVTTEEKDDALSVPQGIIISKEGGKFVRVREGETIIERRVEIGLVSSIGEVEVVSGLVEGDIVILDSPAEK